MHPSPEVIRYLDELTRTDLQNLRDSYFFWLLISSGVVALGVVLEGPEIVHETVGVIRRVSRSERKTPSWITWVALVGWLFVVLGVAGEGIAEALVSKADGLIQTFNDIVLTDAQHEIARAEERAGDAQISAESSEKAARRATASAYQIGKLANELTRKTSELAIKLSNAESAELEERKKVLDMEVWLSPRVLPMIEEPRGLTWARLIYFAGINAIINSVVDEESRRAAGQIAAVIRKAGWNIVGLTSDSNRQVTLTDNFGTTQMADGVTVLSHRLPRVGGVGFFPDEVRSKEAAGVLSDLLEDNGWDVVAVPGDPDPNARLWVPPNTVRIEVGLKPNPYISPNLPKNIQEQRKKIIEHDRQAREERHRAREHDRQIEEMQWWLRQPLPPSPVVPPSPKPEK